MTIPLKRSLTYGLVAAIAAGALVGVRWDSSPIAGAAARGPQEYPVKPEDLDNPDLVVEKTDEEWRQQLTPQQYQVTRQKGTERCGTGAYSQEKRDGMYRCVCCGLPLFDSSTKFESGTGWPSFWEPVGEQNVRLEDDSSWLMQRTEVVCRRCGAHLGHVFNDGDGTPTGMRYCINSAALNLQPRTEPPQPPRH